MRTEGVARLPGPGDLFPVKRPWHLVTLYGDARRRHDGVKFTLYLVLPRPRGPYQCLESARYLLVHLMLPPVLP